MAIIPNVARLLGKRQGGDLVGQFLVVDVVGIKIGVGIDRAHQTRAVKAIRNAGRMTEQIGDGDGPDRLFKCQSRIAVIGLALDANHLPGESGNVVGHRIGQFDAAVIDQQHRSDAGDRLAQGMKAEDRARLHRFAGGHVGLAE